MSDDEYLRDPREKLTFEVVSWPRQNGKTVISEHIGRLEARVAELEAQRAAVLALVDAAKWTEWDDGATLAGEIREALGVAE